MGKTIKVRCNGPGKHVNTIDIDKALRKDIVLKGQSIQGPPSLPERLVLDCHECTAGKVIITRSMIEENL